MMIQSKLQIYKILYSQTFCFVFPKRFKSAEKKWAISTLHCTLQHRFLFFFMILKSLSCDQFTTSYSASLRLYLLLPLFLYVISKLLLKGYGNIFLFWLTTRTFEVIIIPVVKFLVTCSVSEILEDIKG